MSELEKATNLVGNPSSTLPISHSALNTLKGSPAPLSLFPLAPLHSLHLLSGDFHIVQSVGCLPEVESSKIRSGVKGHG